MLGNEVYAIGRHLVSWGFDPANPGAVVRLDTVGPYYYYKALKDLAANQMVREGDIVGLEYDPVRSKVRQILEDQRTEKEAAALLDRVRAWGNDDYQDADVLRFDKKFEGTETLYTFVALKSNGRWYLTGPKFGGLPGKTWDELVDFLVLEGKPVDVYDADAWRGGEA